MFPHAAAEQIRKIEEAKLEAMYARMIQGEEKFDEGENIIPRNFTLKSNHNNKYLRYISEDNGEIDSFLRFSGERMISPYTKFEVDYTGIKREYVHIRSGYNNKFWVRQSSDSNFIVAAAHNVEEDVSKWSCTLFEVIHNEKEKAYSFRHVQLNSLLYLSNSSDQFANCLVAKSSRDNEVYTLSTVTDWDAIFILPKHVAFKGDNGEYLRLASPYLQFSASNAKNSSAAHEIFPAKDGNIQIKNVDSGNFWYYDTNWIIATSSSASEDDRNTLFWPVKVNDNTLALRCLGNNRFCYRTTVDGKTSCLNARGRGIVDEGRMEVEEIVISRIIDNLEYRLKDARIYGEKVLSMAKGDAINKTTEPDTITFKFSYEDKTKRSWTSSVSAKLGFKVTIKAGVPVLGEGKIGVSGEFGDRHEWGETIKQKKITEITYPVTVEPMTRVKINVALKQGTCEVPFSYRRTDVLKNGQRVVHRLHDGLFTGFNSYDLDYRAEKVPMDS